MRILFAPDYRAGTPYQELLARALGRHGIEVSFLSEYYRGLPLFRGSLTKAPDIVHVHWPEAYFSRKHDLWDSLRIIRYPGDLWLTAHYRPVVFTAHNLLPHDRKDESGVLHNIRHTIRSSKAIFVHSKVAHRQLCDTFGPIKPAIHTIPFGDHAVPLGPPMALERARNLLELPLADKICLVFGTVSPYKGSDEIVRFWAKANVPYRLVIIGPVLSDAFARRLHELARGIPTIDLRLLDSWLDDSLLRLWLSAADCSIFNYRDIFTSGAAALARSYGLPLLLPRRLTSVDLDEPHPHVFRFDAFESDFRTQVDRALATRRDYDLAADWRQKTSWDQIAQVTASVYRTVTRKRSSSENGRAPVGVGETGRGP